MLRFYAGAVGHLVQLVTSTDAGVRRHACLALAAVAAHSGELAEAVVAADAFPRALTGLKFPADERVRRAAALLVREVRVLSTRQETQPADHPYVVDERGRRAAALLVRRICPKSRQCLPNRHCPINKCVRRRRPACAQGAPS